MHRDFNELFCLAGGASHRLFNENMLAAHKYLFCECVMRGGRGGNYNCVYVFTPRHVIVVGCERDPAVFPEDGIEPSRLAAQMDLTSHESNPLKTLTKFGPQYPQPAMPILIFP